MPTYTTILFDLDHTLFDFDTSETQAFDITLAAFGVTATPEYLAAHQRINRALWASVEREEISPNEVRSLRFARLAAEIGIDIDPVAMGDAFVAGLGAHGDLYPGTLELLGELGTSASLALITNGIGEVQRARIERLGLAGYFDSIVISGEVGVAKPGAAIFDLAFEQLGWPSKAQALMVGDSLHSDIRGGRDYNIDTCWYNPGGNTLGQEHTPTHEIRHLRELSSLI